MTAAVMLAVAWALVLVAMVVVGLFGNPITGRAIERRLRRIGDWAHRRRRRAQSGARLARPTPPAPKAWRGRGPR